MLLVLRTIAQMMFTHIVKRRSVVTSPRAPERSKYQAVWNLHHRKLVVITGIEYITADEQL